MSRILVCGVQTLYVRGGAEQLVDTLADKLRAVGGHQVDVVNLPYTDAPRSQIVKSFLAWRSLNLRSIHEKSVDLLICTKFPSYAASHPNKVVWLTHQHRQAYDLYGTRFSDMHTRPDGWLFAWLVRRLDSWGLKDARSLYSISKNTADRLLRFNGLRAQHLYPPPRLAPMLRCGEYREYLLAVGRFEPIKRFDLILNALARTTCGALQCVVVGDGMEGNRLKKLAEELGIQERVRFLGQVDDRELADLYANCLGVIYPPYLEDYGYVTVEAFLAHKPVITTSDAGGVLEFVVDGASGFVAEPTPEALADAIERLWQQRSDAPRLGDEGYQRVKDISWDNVIGALTSTL